MGLGDEWACAFTRVWHEASDAYEPEVAATWSVRYFIENLTGAGITDVRIILGNVMQEKVQECLGGWFKFSVLFTCIFQGEPKEFMEKDPFVVYLGNRDHTRG